MDSVIYNYLVSKKPMEEKASYGVIATLLFSLSTLEECTKHHNYEGLNNLIVQTTQEYVKANNWIPYRKKEMVKETGLSTLQITKEIQRLIGENLVILHTIPGDTYLEIV